MPAKVFNICTACKGSGKRGKGNCRKCADGRVASWDHSRRIPCSVCLGAYTDFDAENICDWVPDEWLLHLEIIVQLEPTRQQGLIEQYLGVGLYSVVDYGAHKAKTVEELAECVRRDMKCVQLTKLVRGNDDLRLADGVKVVTSQTGYKVVPFWKDSQWTSCKN